jgi:hypothetical protein
MRAQAVDSLFLPEVRNFLFFSGVQGFDLVSFNIQRGRDHGLPDYNSVRRAYGLTPRRSFLEICPSDTALAAALDEAYAGDIDNVDTFIAGLAEDHVPGSEVGELFAVIIADQFRRLRDGDRYWFENPDAPAALRDADVRSVRSVKFIDVLDLVTDAFRPAHSDAAPRRSVDDLDAMYAAGAPMSPGERRYAALRAAPHSFLALDTLGFSA